MPNIIIHVQAYGAGLKAYMYGTFMKVYGCHTPKRPGENPASLQRHSFDMHTCISTVGTKVCYTITPIAILSGV